MTEALSSSRRWVGELNKGAGIVKVLVRCANNSDRPSRFGELGDKALRLNVGHDPAGSVRVQPHPPALSAAPSSAECNPNGAQWRSAMTVRFAVRDEITASASENIVNQHIPAPDPFTSTGPVFDATELGHESGTCQCHVGLNLHWMRHASTRLLRDDVDIEAPATSVGES